MKHNTLIGAQFRITAYVKWEINLLTLVFYSRDR